MAVNVQVEAPAQPRARTRVLSPAVVLGTLVFVSFVCRAIGAWLLAAPVIFPDEYIYSELGRSIAATGEPLVRGHGASFPALLGPLLASPIWLSVHDVGLARHLVQALEALSMSLAGVPAYLLSRRLGLSARSGLAVAAVALCVPDFIYSGMILSEPFAYPLVLASLLAGVVALERPTRRNQILFFVFAGLAAFARIQFVVLPVAYLLAAAGMGVRERRVRRALLEQWLTLVIVLLGGAAVAAIGLGYYAGVGNHSLSPSTWLGPLGSDLLVTVYVAGWGIVPGGLLGYALAVWRPRARRELAFGTLAGAFTVLVVAEAAAYGDNVHERYTFYAVPLLAVAFLLYVQRGFPHRLFHAVLAALLVAVGTLQPLTIEELKGDVNSPLLIAVQWLTLHTGAGTASLIALTAAIAAVAAVVALSRVPRAATAVALAATLALGFTANGLANDFFQRNAQRVLAHNLRSEPSWVDDAAVGPVPLLQSFGGLRPTATEQLFWNRSVDRVMLLPGAKPFDPFETQDVDVAGDGSLRVAGRPLTGPLLIDRFRTTTVLHGARVRATTPYYQLWVPTTGKPRLATYFAGRYYDGWVAPWARLDVWAHQAGTVRVRVWLPKASSARTMTVKTRGKPAQQIRLRPGVPRALALPVCKAGRWRVVLTFASYGFAGSRTVSARAGMPRFVPGAPAACGS